MDDKDHADKVREAMRHLETAVKAGQKHGLRVMVTYWNGTKRIPVQFTDRLRADVAREL